MLTLKKPMQKNFGGTLCFFINDWLIEKPALDKASFKPY